MASCLPRPFLAMVDRCLSTSTLGINARVYNRYPLALTSFHSRPSNSLQTLYDDTDANLESLEEKVGSLTDQIQYWADTKSDLSVQGRS